MSEYEMLGWPENDETLGKRLERTGLPGAVTEAQQAKARPALVRASVPADEETVHPVCGFTRLWANP